MKIYLLYILIFSVSGCMAQPETEPEIYLIPKGFRGKVNIIFNQSNGDSVKYEENKRVYNIPQSGVLLTRFKDQYGIVNRSYYYVDSLGNREPVEILLNNESDTQKVGIYRNGTVGSYGDADKGNALFYQEFYVTNKENLDFYFTSEYQRKFNQKITEATGFQF